MRKLQRTCTENGLVHLFVYGTLKRGYNNHYYLARGKSIYLGKAETVDAFALYVGRYPYVTPQEPICPIKGELYAVDQNTLAQIDLLEGHPTYYKRRLTKVRLQEDGSIVDAFLYFHENPEGKLVPSGLFIK